MLNISNHRVYHAVMNGQYSTLLRVERKKSSKVLRRFLIIVFSLLLITIFLPWTQNIRSSGYLTTLKPDHKPQHLTSIIGGRVEKWFVQEGDFVTKGDTILKISEIKDAYFDDKLLDRTKNQVDLKKQSAENYQDKLELIDEQITVLKEQLGLKLSQAKNKLKQAILGVQNDSIAFTAAQTNYQIAQNQFERADSLYQQGLKSKVDYEQRKLKMRETQSYEIAAKNKWLNSKNEVLNLKLELSALQVKYQTDYNKLISDRIATNSQKLDAEGNVNKLENTYSNYLFRNGLYYITAPQSGYITKTKTYGIGELVKEGQEIVSLMPKDYELAMELYVEPIDLPLIHVKEKVRIQFDGWPSVVFSGWPDASYGTYGGEVYAVDQFISPNGMYRILVKPDTSEQKWPDELRVGSGASNLIMLGEVPIWYEFWRRINGFPPDFYKAKKAVTQNKQSAK